MCIRDIALTTREAVEAPRPGAGRAGRAGNGPNVGPESGPSTVSSRGCDTSLGAGSWLEPVIRSGRTGLVAHAPNRHDDLRPLRVVFELAARPLDMDVDQPGVASVSVAPHLLQKHLTGEHLSLIHIEMCIRDSACSQPE